MTLAEVRSAAEREGLAWRGAFHPMHTDDVPQANGGISTATLILLGFTGKTGWESFAASREAHDGSPNPLDRWSRRIIDGLAAATGALALYPFGGPPWHPFQRWAQRAEPVHPSPLGMLIHPEWGLWHSYRGALAFGERFALDEAKARPSPCESCATKPCLSACPVGAFSPIGPAHLDETKCKGFLASPRGQDCLSRGCQARRACPIGAVHRYDSGQAFFHMRSFYGG
ncbi:MAG: hypothetical protein EPO08_14120 [Rhodospirillaceae bacterium]|nr:MAG: hypothetical protein EPO08_14120 [Rhodospirillaceae bacterium]